MGVIGWDVRHILASVARGLAPVAPTTLRRQLQSPDPPSPVLQLPAALVNLNFRDGFFHVTRLQFTMVRMRLKKRRLVLRGLSDAKLGVVMVFGQGVGVRKG